MWSRERHVGGSWVAFCALMAGLGCSELFVEPAPPPAAESARLDSGAARLDVQVASRTLTLEWGDTKRVHMELDRLRLGRVAAFNPDRNYSPDTLKDFPVDDLVWLRPVAARLLRPSDGSPAVGSWTDHQRALLELRTETPDGQAGATWLLHLEATGKGAFRCDLELADADLRAATAADAPDDLHLLIDLPVETTPSERLYGMGEVFEGPEHRGKRRPMHIVADLSTESGYNEVHVPIPLVIGSGGWGLFVENRRPAVFDLGATEPGRVRAIFNSGHLRWHLLAADTPLAITGGYTRISGTPAMPARWAFGTLIWRNENKNQAEVMDDMTQIRKHDLAISGMWLDRPFDTHVNNFDFDPARFPEPDKMIADVQALGMRMGMWSTPYAEKGSTYHQQVVDNGWYVDLPAIAKGLVKWGGPIDLTNPDAYAMWRTAIGTVAKRGIEGWKLDFAEDVHIGLSKLRIHYGFHDGSDERTMHHGYALPYHKVYHDNLPADGGFLLCRAGTYGDQAITSMIWPGDLDANLMFAGQCDKTECHVGGLPASVAAMLGLSASGYPLYNADTGGYRHQRPSKQTFMRWLAQTGLAAVQQIGGGKQSNPWDFTKYDGSQFDQEVLDAAVYYTRLHTRLFPYLYTAMKRARAHLPGPVRPFGLVHPELQDQSQFDALASTQYYLGDALLVAPVVDDKAGRSAILPLGRWFDWWTKSPVPGDESGPRTLSLDVPLDRIPLWLRAGGIVPMLRPTVDTLAPATVKGVDSFANDAGRLYALIGPGAPGSAAVYDGTSLRLVDGPKSATLQVEVTPGDEFIQGVDMQLWMTAPASVSSAEGPIANQSPPCKRCWWLSGKVLNVRLPPGAHKIEIARTKP